MKNKLFFLIFFIFQFNNIYSQQVKYILDADQLNKVIENVATEEGVPGVAIGIIVNDQLSHFYSYGVADKDSKAAITKNTAFQIGSLTKPIIASLALQLHNRGKVDLNREISTYLPGIINSEDIKKIRLKHLLSHSSGLPQEPINRQDIAGTPTVPKPYSIDELYKGLNSTEILFTPGTYSQYSNLGFKLAGHILERSYKKPLEETLKLELLDKLGMNQTYINNPPKGIEEASHYWNMDNATKAHLKWKIGEVWGSGGLSSTINDMAKFLSLQFKRSKSSEGIIPSDLIQLSHTPNIQANRYFSEFIGLGWYIKQDKKYGFNIFHSGDADGNSSYISILPEYGIGFIVLTNRGGTADEIGEEVTDIIFNSISNKKKALSNAFGEQDWGKLAEISQELILINPSNSRAHYFLGKALYKLKKYNEAIKHLQIANIDGLYRDYALFYLASCFASKNKDKKAYEFLTRAVNLGYLNGDELLQDPNLKKFSDRDYYKKLARHSHDH